MIGLANRWTALPPRTRFQRIPESALAVASGVYYPHASGRILLVYEQKLAAKNGHFSVSPFNRSFPYRKRITATSSRARPFSMRHPIQSGDDGDRRLRPWTDSVETETPGPPGPDLIAISGWPVFAAPRVLPVMTSEWFIHGLSSPERQTQSIRWFCIVSIEIFNAARNFDFGLWSLDTWGT